MLNSHLVFIPSPGAGHLLSNVELAKLLLRRDHRLSVTIILFNLSAGAKPTTDTPPLIPRLTFVEIPSENSGMALITPKTFMLSFLDRHKPDVRDTVQRIIDSHSVRLSGFVVDMFCASMTDVANEFGTPTYIYFTSAAATLGLMFYLQAKRDNEDYDVTDLKDSGLESLCIPSFVNPLPVKVLPEVLLDKEGGSKTFLDLAVRFRDSKGIIVNSFQELETHGLDYLSSSDLEIPPVFPVGPVLNLESKKADDKTDEIITWLNDQPESSVVFLCFGSLGGFDEKQVKQIAVAIERSGQRFLWSLRRPPPKEKVEYPVDYESFDEVLPEGFLERTMRVGKVIGWAPQIAVLSHPSVGGFVSHCGWNSTLESIWCGVPVAAWPLYAEQQLNAFQLVVEQGMAVEIRMDYRRGGGGSGMMVTAEEIESGIRKVMCDGEMRKKVKEMKEKSRLAVVEGGSSYKAIVNFISHYSAL